MSRRGRQQRPASGDDVVAGRNPVVEALRAGVPAKTLYVADAGGERVAEAVRSAQASGVTVRRSTRDELERLAGGVPHQGVVLTARRYAYVDPDELTGGVIIALDGVTDPQNLGAVIRSAAAFGASGVVLPQRRSAGVTPAVWKASAGTLAAVPVARAVNLTRQLAAYRDRGMFVVGLAGEATTDIAASNLLDGPLVLAVGAEGKGLSRLVREACDELARIPIAPTAESLNAGVAAGIALYEIARARERG
ncbi:MAG: 23S rRNA (guanosine(2251)-2'-O)-methyltransferase RlmB [Streptosporangiales bacterium]|nr:23S rRNA (guanosine(2251)-2'-O)-methyltransferase RlmB [Streptosporangiales bacterium]